MDDSSLNSIIDYYTGFGEKEWTRLDREPIEFIVNLHYINQFLPPSGRILDIGAGPGKYSMVLAKKGLRITLADLTPKLVEIAKTKAVELKLTEKFDGFHVADAQDLTEFQSEFFDASLMLGPMYHLQTEHGRIKAVQELHRVTKYDGIVFVAFRSRINHVLYSLLQPKHWSPNDNMDAINEFIDTGIFNHTDKGRYTGAYFFNIADVCPLMESVGFETVDLIGSTNLGALLTDEHWNYWTANDQEYSKMINLLIRTAKDPTVLGMSSHLLYIGRKK